MTIRVPVVVLTIVACLFGVALVYAATSGYDAWADRNNNGVIDPSDRATAIAYYDANMGAERATRTPRSSTPTRTPTPRIVSPTRTPTVRATQVQTSVPTRTATASATRTSTPPVTGNVPLCPDHDPRQWHALYDAARNCHYDHEHKDDPAVLDSVFGPVGQEWGGQSISYPWETSNENLNKHRVYGWMVVKDAICKSNYTALSFTDIRAQYHGDGNGGATTRFHSFYFQAQACDQDDPNWRGKISVGGHQDYGNLVLLRGSGQEVVVPLPGDPTGETSLRRIHGSTERARPDFTWYGQTGAVRYSGIPTILTGVSPRAEDWGPVDANDPSRLLFYCQQPCGQNGSWVEPHLFTLYIPPDLDLDGDGLVTYDGYTDRHGNVVMGTCGTLGPDCVPLHLENMKVGSYQFRADEHGIPPSEHDTSPGARGVAGGEWWITYPN